MYASTNKVYGGMEDVPVVEEATRWRYADLPLGCPETQPLDFHALRLLEGHRRPVRARLCPHLRPADRGPAPVLHLRPAPVRRGGPGLGGVDDHRRCDRANRSPIYGDGKQIRDVLYVDDLLNAYDAASSSIE